MSHFMNKTAYLLSLGEMEKFTSLTEWRTNVSEDDITPDNLINGVHMEIENVWDIQRLISEAPPKKLFF